MVTFKRIQVGNRKEFRIHSIARLKNFGFTPSMDSQEGIKNVLKSRIAIDEELHFFDVGFHGICTQSRHGWFSLN